MSKKADFDYCFWAKLFVAIPLIPIVAITVASMFNDGLTQSIAAVISVILVVLAARKIDRIPSLQKKIGAKE